MLGNRIKQLRMKKGYTQEQLASGIISTSYLSEIENNHRSIPDYIAPSLAEKLDVTEDYILGKDVEERIELLRKEIRGIFERLSEDLDYDFMSGCLLIKKKYGDLKGNEIAEQYFFAMEMFGEFKYSKHKAAETENKIKSYLTGTSSIDSYPLLVLNRIRGVIEYRKRNIQRSITYFERAIDNALNNQYKEHLSILFQNIGTCYFTADRYQRAVHYFSNALEMYQKNANLKGRLKVCIHLANSMSALGDEQEAISKYNQAINLLKYINDPLLESSAKYNLAHSYLKTKNYRDSIKMAINALRLKEKLKDKEGVLRCYLLIAEIYLLEEKHDKFSEIVPIASLNTIGTKTPGVLGKYHYLLGKYFSLNNNLEQFKANLEKAISYFSKAGNFKMAGKISFELAEKEKNETHYRRSAEFFDKAFKEKEEGGIQ